MCYFLWVHALFSGIRIEGKRKKGKRKKGKRKEGKRKNGKPKCSREKGKRKIGKLGYRICPWIILSSGLFCIVCIYLYTYTRAEHAMPKSAASPFPCTSRWRRGVAVERRTCDREVVGSSLGRALRRKNSGQVSHTYG